MTDRSTRRRGGGLPRNSAENATVVTADPRPDRDAPAYEHVDGSGDADLHRHFGDAPHAHADPPHYHDGDQVTVLHDYPDPDAPTVTGGEPYERPTLDGPHPTAEQHPDPQPEVEAENGQPDLDADEMARFVDQARSLPPDQQETVKANLRGVLASIDNTTPAPAPAPEIPARFLSRAPGTSIAHPVAQDTLNAMRFPGITDPDLRHEMTWTGILTEAVVELSAYHADDRPQGGPGPQLAPDELIAAIGAAWEQIRQPRLKAREVANDA